MAASAVVSRASALRAEPERIPDLFSRGKGVAGIELEEQLSILPIPEPNHGQEPDSDFGGAERDRTADLLVANEALSQLSYSPRATFLS